MPPAPRDDQLDAGRRSSAPDARGNAVRRRERSAARQDGGDAGSAHGAPVGPRLRATTSRHGGLRRRAAHEQRVGRDVRARVAGHRPGRSRSPGPARGFTSRSRFPTLTGTAGKAAGDDPTVTVRIFDGADTSGAPVTTLSAPRSGAAWSVTPTTPIPAGTTPPRPRRRAPTAAPASARRSTFTIVQPGDRDHDGILDDEDSLDGSKPPVPGKSVVVRVVSGDVFIKFPAGQGPRAVTPPAGLRAAQGRRERPDRLPARHRQRPGRADLGGGHRRQEDPEVRLLRRASSRSSRRCPRRSRRRPRR